MFPPVVDFGAVVAPPQAANKRVRRRRKGTKTGNEERWCLTKGKESGISIWLALLKEHPNWIKFHDGSMAILKQNAHGITVYGKEYRDTTDRKTCLECSTRQQAVDKNYIASL